MRCWPSLSGAAPKSNSHYRMENLIVGIVSALLIIYLLATIIRPEKF
ncbi:MAG: potassium-transporting ATPase subunit F [Verrucomicrobia bacterium]|nr:potassium-transporting ATPase subunit F [Verrucomicrobiota bacterium]